MLEQLATRLIPGNKFQLLGTADFRVWVCELVNELPTGDIEVFAKRINGVGQISYVCFTFIETATVVVLE